MIDYKDGIKKEVAEIKFLIHDLHVEDFINDVLHYHVTLNTDLEIYNIQQAQVLHGADVHELKAKLVEVRKTYRDDSPAVKSFSPDRTVQLTARRYLDKIHETCDLILNPLWGRSDRVLSFLPDQARSVRSRARYRNCIGLLYGMHQRIEAFLDERNANLREEFDIAEDIQDYTRDVVLGYVVEKSEARIDLQLAQLDRAVIAGNHQRFRRMFFNLIMNAVDAMSARKAGVINVSAVIEGDRVAMRVRDEGAGMPREKINLLLADRHTLDGELHSLGFVFVRQTVAQFGGEIDIDSKVGSGTTITVRLPYLPDKSAEPPEPSRREKHRLPEKYRPMLAQANPVTEPVAGTGHETPAKTAKQKAPAPEGPGDGKERLRQCGKLAIDAYRKSQAQFAGSIFAMAVTEDNRVDLFTVKPYESDWNITHEDLSPMYFQATYRGRIEDDELKKPILILKPPQSMHDYFDFKDVPIDERRPERFNLMVRDEGIRIARQLIATGLDADIPAYLGDAPRFFAAEVDVLTEPFPLSTLAHQPLTVERVLGGIQTYG